MCLTHAVAPDATPLRVAIAGNPNVGKTTLFNALTGAHQKVANYPGTTVEKRVGHYRDGDLAIALVDLPGTYSLGGQSPEERVAEEALLQWGGLTALAWVLAFVVFQAGSLLA